MNNKTFRCLMMAGTIAHLFTSACTREGEKYPQGIPIQADVLSFDPSSINDLGDAPRFVYGPKTFPQMDNLENLSSPRFKMLQGGNLEVREAIGTVITSSQFSGYSIPSLEYRAVNGVVKPVNNKSLMMLSASYQFDTLIEKIESLTGYKPEEFFDGFSSFNVLFHPSIVLEESDEQTRKYETTNAAYVAGVKQFALFSLGKDERVPMTFNPQIVSHEFGHAIFEKYFFNNKFEKCNPDEVRSEKLFPGRIENEYSVRGINEGFADFVSFVWTGSTNVIQSSLGDLELTRERNFSKATFDYDTYSSKEAEVCNGRFYCIGTLWAKTLLDVFNSRSLDPKSPEARQQFLREIVSLLAKVGVALRDADGAALPSPDERTKRCFNRDVLSPAADGDMLSAFFVALIDKADPAIKKSWCTSIISNFGTSGFPISARKVCQ
ncbi:MAG: hypothetical protein RI953_2050 [Pseudomonadota bacterium]|jgi:hypothetical protein